VRWQGVNVLGGSTSKGRRAQKDGEGELAAPLPADYHQEIDTFYPMRESLKLNLVLNKAHHESSYGWKRIDTSEQKQALCQFLGTTFTTPAY
jgi:hypothetical protein